MKTISTKYLEATETMPARIKAYDMDGNSVTLSRWARPDLDGEALYLRVAKTLRDKMGWKGHLVGGGTKEGYVFCFIA